jgi:type 1 glutamine amidotransferase
LHRRTLLATPFAQKFAPRVAFITGDDEYRSEYSMPALAQILERRHHLKTKQGIDGLKDADLMVLFLRWRQFPEDQLQAILDFEKSGRPVVGFRTSTHAFKYPAGHPRESENDGFPLRVFGAKWTRHHGHLSTTRTTKADDHEILNGVNPEMILPSWLYTVNPLQGNCRPILTGHAINPQNGRDDGPQPVAWTKLNGRDRVFFTTLGHPNDFKNADFRRLTLNAFLWALNLPIPKDGAGADFPAPYNPPSSGIR